MVHEINTLAKALIKNEKKMLKMQDTFKKQVKDFKKTLKDYEGEFAKVQKENETLIDQNNQLK